MYWKLFPSAFYAPYARYEKATADDAQALGLVIQESLRRRLGPRRIMAKGYSIGTVTVFDAKGTESGFRFVVGVPVIPYAISRPTVNGIGVFIPCEISPNSDAEDLVTRNLGQEGNELVDYVVHIGPDPWKGWSPDGTLKYSAVVDEVLPDNQFATTPSPPNQRPLGLSQEESKALIALFAGVNGDPMRISESFVRMLYFSVTVITIIGFGDIVPMTPIARLTVAIEGMLGVVLAGLSLMQR